LAWVSDAVLLQRNDITLLTQPKGDGDKDVIVWYTKYHVLFMTRTSNYVSHLDNQILIIDFKLLSFY
jgi:hypothetical protein